MSEPIKAGDACEVIGGLGGQASPNLGLRVKVISLQGEHSRFGRVWRCHGEGLMQLHDSGSYVRTDEADLAASWLRKIDPPGKSDASSVGDRHSLGQSVAA